MKPPSPSAWLSEDYWHLAVEHLVGGPDYVLLLGEGFRILQANETFLREVTGSSEKPIRSLLDTVSEGSAEELTQLAASGKLDGLKLELLHPVRGGSRSVQYSFRLHGAMWFTVGRDQTVQLELVSQLATLVSDLETRVDTEKERSEALRALSEKDPLTGLANRRRFERALALCRQKNSEEGLQFSVISLDIDHFKKVNDIHGHLVGDEVLRRVARVLSESTRDGDCVARMGGEEFMVLAEGAPLERAMDLAERLRRAVEMAPMPSPLGRITVSIGVAATAPGRAQGDRDLILVADNALYAAKNGGRNCVRFIE